MKPQNSSITLPKLDSDTAYVSWIKRGKFRRLVFDEVNGMIMPSEIAKNISEGRVPASAYAQISRSLAELQAAGLVAIENPEEKTGRLWHKTKKGEQIHTLLK